jgi:MoaA/NifB/PqqE/SkfB family radical SAM enzyme
MRKDFDELCAAVQKAGILSAVVTNGMYIAENPSLLDHLDEVVFSLDSAVAEHTDRVRGPGVHAAVLKAIEVSLAHAKRPRLFINMVVLRDNLEQIDPMLRFCEERGIGLNAQPANFGMKYYDDGAKGIALSNEDTRAMYRQLAEWRRQGRPLMFGSGTYGRSALWPDYTVLSRRTEQGESSCAMGRFYIHIDANGDVHPCVQHSADFQPKNIGRHGLDEALRNAQHHNCNDCYGAYLNERKNLFGLRPATVWEYLRR